MSADAEDMFGCGCVLSGGAMALTVLLAALALLGDCAGCVDMAEVIHGKAPTVQVMPAPVQVEVPPAPAVPTPTLLPGCETAIQIGNGWTCLDP